MYYPLILHVLCLCGNCLRHHTVLIRLRILKPYIMKNRIIINPPNPAFCLFVSTRPFPSLLDMSSLSARAIALLPHVYACCFHLLVYSTVFRYRCRVVMVGFMSSTPRACFRQKLHCLHCLPSCSTLAAVVRSFVLSHND